ncbi:TPA: hypothetical protein ROX87_003565 [Bacillus thuringiensis]|uniref:Mannosyltransferase related to Gpi18 n=4 Tax=Bacillus cereus group TaxID=86661 RepID=A0A9X6U2F1_BACTU|nr:MULTISPECIES: hypothetical protein [Bacillus]AUB66483.1 hypothetical protein CSW12_27185 [Bacillus cereus]EJS48585.1 hypothetical protein ICE_04680 [Bacillus cereus BAG1X1-2]EJV86395.1 hypothetical protein IGE_00285 [Bacillus cereus HuB1-1]EPF09779.1 hypothetical protein ICA_04420 [Bacillus cereus BAG1O-3]KAB2452594.1 hypothetical protein F8165_03640 [Bacillus cereus]
MNFTQDRWSFKWLHFYLMVVVVASLLLRIYLAFHLEGYERDQLFFVDWMNTVGKYGLGDVYAHGDLVNYPPFFLALLGIYGVILSFFNISVDAAGVLIRVPSIAFEVVAIIIFAIASKRIENSIVRAALVTFFAFSPAVIVDGTIWGQVDMLHSILMVSSILLLMYKPTWSGAIYAIALLAKFQSIVIAPVFAMYFLKIIFEKREGKQLIKFIIGFCIPLLIFGLYFAAHGTFITMLTQAYLNAVGTFPTVTVFAMNIWYYAIGTDPNTVDTIQVLPHITLKTVGLILLSIAAALTCLYVFFHRHMNTAILLKAATFISFAFFMLPTQMHERYAFPALVFVIFLLLYEMKWTGIALGLTLTIFLNLVMVLYAGSNTNMGMFIVTINVFIFYAMCKLLVKEYCDRFELLIKKQ